MKSFVLTICITLGAFGAAVAGEPVGDPAGEPVTDQATDKEKQAETQPATPAEPALPAKAQRPAPESRKEPVMPPATVARSQFTTGIQGREPVDSVDAVNNNAETVFFFTEIRGGKGQTITHEWWRDGEFVAEVPFQVGGNRWRVWSSKDFMDEWTGEWTVRVTDDEGRKLSESSFRYTAAPADAPAAEPDAMPGQAGSGKAQGTERRGMGDDRSDKKPVPAKGSQPEASGDEATAGDGVDAAG